MEKPKAIVCDIDGTIASEKKRHELATLPNGEVDWDKYFDEKLLIQDKVNIPLKNRLKQFKKNGYIIIFLTGRRENLRKITTSWLLKNCIDADFLVMREQESNYMDIEDYKTRKINEIKEKFDIHLAFEDLPEGIAALKNAKIKHEQIKFE